MPFEIYIAVLAACASNILLAAVWIAASVYIKSRIASWEGNVSRINGDLSLLIRESRGAVAEARQAIAQASTPMDDLGSMAHTARGWADRADRLVDAAGSAAAPPLRFLTQNTGLVRAIVGGVVSLWLTPRR